MASEWKTDLLGNLCLMKNGYAFKSKDFVSQGIPVIKIKNVKPNRILVDDLSYVPTDVAEQRKKWLIEKGEILLTMTGNRADGSPESWVGKAAIFNESTPYLLNQRVSALKAKDEAVIDTNYLGYYLSSWQTQLYFIKRANSSGGQANISPEIVMNMPVHYPPLATQRKIVSILATLDQKIKTNAAINDNLQQQAAALFANFYDHAETEVGFTEIIQILGGGTPKTGESSYWNGNVPFFTPKDVGSPYTISTEKTITEEGLSHCNSRLYPVNTVFVTARGTVGKVGLPGVPMAMNQSCYALVGKETHQLLVYFYTLKAVDRLKHKASGAVFDAITTRDFESEIIMKLSDEDAQGFLDVAEPIYQAVLSNSFENLRLAALRDSLLPKLMSGEIDVSAIQL